MDIHSARPVEYIYSLQFNAWVHPCTLTTIADEDMPVELRPDEKRAYTTDNLMALAFLERNVVGPNFWAVLDERLC